MIPCLVFGQGVQIEQVTNFSGGLVNSISNSLMENTQALVLENYDITEIGSLKRRMGLSRVFSDTLDDNGISTYGIIPVSKGYFKELLLLRDINGSFNVTKCDNETAICTTIVFDYLNAIGQDLDYPYNIDHVVCPDGIAIATSSGDYLIYDTNTVFAPTPRISKQPVSSVFNGNGELSGSFSYKYTFLDSAGNESNMSAPTETRLIKNGKIVLKRIGGTTDTVSIPSFVIYRKKDDGKYLILDTIQSRTIETSYTDSIGTTSDADSADFNWGYTDIHEIHTVNPPGAITINSIDSCTTDSFGVGCIYYDVFANEEKLGYSIVYKNKFGNYSMMSPPVWDTLRSIVADTANWQYKVSLTDIPIPDDSSVTNKYLLRTHVSNAGTGDTGEDSVQYNDWVILTEIDLDSTTYTDSLRPRFYYSPIYCSGYDSVIQVSTSFSGTRVYSFVKGFTYGDEPENSCFSTYDKMTIFPKSISYHGDRMYVVGDENSINTLWYSEFGTAYDFPTEKQIFIPSKKGDWLAKVFSIGNDKLLLFRQNSIFLLSGLSYYQYSLDEIVSGIGLLSPRTVASEKNKIYFLHNTGVYEIFKSSPVPGEPISIFIQNTIDSISGVNNFGEIVNGEYFLGSCINSDTINKTYIYSSFPKPHWKSYSFGLKDAVAFDMDTSNVSYSPDKYVFLLADNKLYRWNYSTADTLDDTLSFIATYQSKYFLDNPIREKLLYIDLKGKGICDSLIVSLYDRIDTDKDGILIRTDTVYVNFADHLKDRLYYDEIVTRLSVKIQDFGLGDYTLDGYDIGYLIWDEGKSR